MREDTGRAANAERDPDVLKALEREPAPEDGVAFAVGLAAALAPLFVLADPLLHLRSADARRLGYATDQIEHLVAVVLHQHGL